MEFLLLMSHPLLLLLLLLLCVAEVLCQVRVLLAVPAVLQRLRAAHNAGAAGSSG
jgi:hypothetical protein